MPIFKMKCRECGNIFEALFKTASSSAECPECNSSNLEKLPSEIAVVNSSATTCRNADICPNASPCCCGGRCGGHI